MPRKTPVRHHVRNHQRRNANVTNHNRGSGHKVRDSGVNPSASVQLLRERQSKGTIDEHGRKLKKIGEKISYLDNGRRVSGIVVGIRAEYYLVERNGKVWKVDRHSIFTRVGGALGGAGAKLLTAGGAGVRGVAGLAKDEVGRRLEERANARAWKKEMEAEEKDVLKRAEFKARGERERVKFREKIRKGPLWKRSARIIRQIVSEETSKAVKEAQMKALEKSLGKERARRTVKRFREVEKRERRERLGADRPRKAKAKKGKKKDKKITITVS